MERGHGGFSFSSSRRFGEGGIIGYVEADRNEEVDEVEKRHLDEPKGRTN